MRLLLRFSAFLLGVSVLLVPALRAAPKTDLSRLTPVAADEQIPISDFFRMPTIYGVDVNPGGTKLASIVTDAQDRRHLLIHDLATNKAHTVGAPGSKDISWFWWRGDDQLSFSIVKEKWWNFGLFSVPADDSVKPYPVLQYCGIRYLGSSREKANTPLVWLKYDALDSGRDLGVRRIYTKYDRARAVDLDTAPDLFDTVRVQNERVLGDAYPQPKDLALSYFTDQNRELAFSITARDGIRTLNRLDGESWTPVPIDLEKVEVIGSGNRTDQLLVYFKGENGQPGSVSLIDTVTGKVVVQLYRDKQYDFDGGAWQHPVSGEILGLAMQRGYPTNLWFGEGLRALQKSLDGLFPGQYVKIYSTSDDMSVLVVTARSDLNPITYHYVDTRTWAVSPIRNSRPWIDPARMNKMSLIKFTTRDGHKLDAYLTLPKGTTKEKPAPLVVLPHGGPWVRDTWGWNSEVQFLASRGYAVLQPNYRGSEGYNFLFTIADRWDFIKMQQDVSDAAKAACENALIDADRVAIMGWSFGGYHAIAGAEEQPCRYRCAIALSGVYDIERMMKAQKRDDAERNTAHYQYMIRFMGTPDAEKARYVAASPINFIDRIGIPVFVAHGKEDTAVDLSESKRLVALLKKKGIPVEFMLMGKEGHGSLNIDTTVELYSRIEAFLAEHLAPRAK